MRKIRLTESQLLMLQQLKDEEPKNKVLKINEDQYNRLFKGTSKVGLNEGQKKEVDLPKFAQELIVFIKDMLSRPETAPYSDYWLELGLSKDKLIKMLEDEGLLTLSLDEADGVTKYVSEKHGFRRKVKECYKKINELGDAGYPAGAEDDSRAPFNEPNYNSEPEIELGVKADKEIVKLIYYSEDMDGLCIFKKGNDLFTVTLESLVTFKGEKLEPYLDSDQTLETANGETANNYINDKLAHKQIKVFSNNAPDGELSLITPELKKKLIHWYGEDKTLVGILNTVKETTGAASSGAYVGGMSGGPIKKDMTNSPKEAMSDLINDDMNSSSEINQEYTHFAVFKDSGKIADGWDYKGVDVEDIKEYSKYDLIDNYPDHKPSEFKIVTKQGLKNKGVDPFNSNNWFKIGVDETTSTVSVGGDSGTFAYDAPAGDGSDFWTAGNKQNKKGTPMVKGGKVHEGDIRKGQVYKNGLVRRKVIDIKNSGNPLGKKIIVVRQWGDKPARDFNIEPSQWGQWELIHESKKILKITEAQLKRVMESDNQTATAYPNGEMVGFDDCTKLNNNKVAQNGGCSQGSIDNVVKTKKTKNSVVAEGFNPNVAAGSTYAIEVKPIKNGAFITLTQDNGQHIVVHYDDISDLIKVLKSVY